MESYSKDNLAGKFMMQIGAWKLKGLRCGLQSSLGQAKFSQLKGFFLPMQDWLLNLEATLSQSAQSANFPSDQETESRLATMLFIIAKLEHYINAKKERCELDGMFWASSSLESFFAMKTLFLQLQSLLKDLLKQPLDFASNAETACLESFASISKLIKIIEKNFKKTFNLENWEADLQNEGYTLETSEILLKGLWKTKQNLGPPKKCKCQNEKDKCFCKVILFCKREAKEDPEQLQKHEQDLISELDQLNVGQYMQSPLYQSLRETVQLFLEKPDLLESCSLVSSAFFTDFYQIFQPDIKLSEIAQKKEENNLNLDLTKVEAETLSWLQLLTLLEEKNRRFLRVYNVQDRKREKLIGEVDLNEVGAGMGQLAVKRFSCLEGIPEEVGLPQSLVDCDPTQFSLRKDTTNQFILLSEAKEHPCFLKMQKKSHYVLHKDDLINIGDVAYLYVKECINNINREEEKGSNFNEVDTYPLGSFNSVSNTPSLTLVAYLKGSQGLKYQSSRQLINQTMDLQVGSRKDKNLGEPQQLVVESNMVSRAHCRIFGSCGMWAIEDLASKNGTFLSLNHHRVREEAGKGVILECDPDNNIKVQVEDGLEVYFGKNSLSAAVKFKFN